MWARRNFGNRKSPLNLCDARIDQMPLFTQNSQKQFASFPFNTQMFPDMINRTESKKHVKAEMVS